MQPEASQYAVAASRVLIGWLVGEELEGTDPCSARCISGPPSTASLSAARTPPVFAPGKPSTRTARSQPAPLPVAAGGPAPAVHQLGHALQKRHSGAVTKPIRVDVWWVHRTWLHSAVLKHSGVPTPSPLGAAQPHPRAGTGGGHEPPHLTASQTTALPSSFLRSRRHGWARSGHRLVTANWSPTFLVAAPIPGLTVSSSRCGEVGHACSVPCPGIGPSPLPPSGVFRNQGGRPIGWPPFSLVHWQPRLSGGQARSSSPEPASPHFFGATSARALTRSRRGYLSPLSFSLFMFVVFKLPLGLRIPLSSFSRVLCQPLGAALACQSGGRPFGAPRRRFSRAKHLPPARVRLQP